MMMHVYLLGVFFVPIFVDCLDSQVVGTEDKMHIESQVGPEAEGNVAIGKSCDVGRDRDKVKSHRDSSNVVGSDSSPSTLRKQKRRPKSERNKTSDLAPTPTLSLPSGPDPIGPPAQVVVPSPKPQLLSQDSYIHGAPVHIVHGSCDLVEGFDLLKSVSEDNNTTTTTTKRQ